MSLVYNQLGLTEAQMKEVIDTTFAESDLDKDDYLSLSDFREMVIKNPQLLDGSINPIGLASPDTAAWARRMIILHSFFRKLFYQKKKTLSIQLFHFFLGYVSFLFLDGIGLKQNHNYLTQRTFEQIRG